MESIYHIFLSKVIGPAVNNGYINRDIETIYNFSFWITNVSWIALTITLAVISKSSNVRTGLIVLSLLKVLRVLVYRVFA